MILLKEAESFEFEILRCAEYGCAQDDKLVSEYGCGQDDNLVGERGCARDDKLLLPQCQLLTKTMRLPRRSTWKGSSRGWPRASRMAAWRSGGAMRRTKPPPPAPRSLPPTAPAFRAASYQASMRWSLMPKPRERFSSQPSCRSLPKVSRSPWPEMACRIASARSRMRRRTGIL